MKKQQKFLIWFGYFLLLVIAFAMHDYFVKHNLLSDVYVLIIELMFLFIGWLGARLEIKYGKHKKKK